jgi:RNA polymerase sigma-70 factor (ECF subfamily)
MSIDVEAYYEKYAPMIFRRCRQMLGNEEDALDAVQDVFVRLINAKRSLTGQFPSSLLYTIATNTCLNRIRWKKRHAETFRDFEDMPLTSHDEGFEQVEAGLIMELILKTESESAQAICFMYHVDGMTLKEIGDAVGLSASGVRKRLQAFNARARKVIDGGKRHE